MTEDARKLLAGYATNTLTDEEKKALFAAALDDPELFAEIASEEPLRELLSQPAARAELLNRIEPVTAPFRERLAAWMRRPGPLAGLATAAVAIMILALVPLMRVQPMRTAVEVARVPAVRPAEAVRPAPVEPAKPQPKAVSKKSAPVMPVPPPALKLESPAPVLAALQPATLPLDYAVLKRDSAGSFVEIEKGSPMDDGAVVKLRFRSVEAGRLAVRDADRPLFTGQLAANRDVEVGPIEMDRDHTIEVAFDPGLGARLMAFEAAPERRKAAAVTHRDTATADEAPEKSATVLSESRALRFEIFLRRK